MADKSTVKLTKTYSLDPDVITWVAKKAARLTVESFEDDGARVSESQLVNDILAEAMAEDKGKTSPKLQSPAKKNAELLEAV